MAKQDGRNRTPSAQAALRKQVVQFLRKKKGTQKEAAEIFGLSKRGVEEIWRRYKQRGCRGIEEKKRGVKGGKKINGVQSAEVRKLIKQKLPDQLKLPFGLWTREAVKQLIFSRYGMSRPARRPDRTPSARRSYGDRTDVAVAEVVGRDRVDGGLHEMSTL